MVLFWERNFWSIFCSSYHVLIKHGIRNYLIKQHFEKVSNSAVFNRHYKCNEEWKNIRKIALLKLKNSFINHLINESVKNLWKQALFFIQTWSVSEVFVDHPFRISDLRSFKILRSNEISLIAIFIIRLHDSYLSINFMTSINLIPVNRSTSNKYS